MTEPLPARLRAATASNEPLDELALDAADRIEQLRKERDRLEMVADILQDKITDLTSRTAI